MSNEKEEPKVVLPERYEGEYSVRKLYETKKECVVKPTREMVKKAKEEKEEKLDMGRGKWSLDKTDFLGTPAERFAREGFRKKD